MLFIFTPCRVSFCLFVLLAFATKAEHAIDITFGEAPRVRTLQPQEQFQ